MTQQREVIFPGLVCIPVVWLLSKNDDLLVAVFKLGQRLDDAVIRFDSVMQNPPLVQNVTSVAVAKFGNALTQADIIHDPKNAPFRLAVR